MIPIQLGGNSILPMTYQLGSLPSFASPGAALWLRQELVIFPTVCSVEKAQGQSIRKDLFLTQFHDNKVNYNLLRIEDYCASSTPIPFWGAG